LGLKLQRKVPWGAGDTIIRFSFLGDVEGIKALLDGRQSFLDDVDPNYGRTPLHYAVRKNHIGACRLLLQAGADRFNEDESNTSPTQTAWEHVFTKKGSPETLDHLRALFPTEDHDHWLFSPVHEAVLGIGGKSPTEMLQTDHGRAIVNNVDAYGRTALHWSCLRGDLEAVRHLLDAGADVDALDKSQCAPLQYAVSSGIPRIVELLILQRADVNTSNDRGDTPLHCAVRHTDDVETVKILIRAGAQVNRPNFLGTTPFACAALAGRIQSGRYLLHRGADRYVANKYGYTPLRETIHYNCHDFLRMLLETETRYRNDVSKAGSSILHSLALEGDTETVGILRAANMSGLDIDMRNLKGETAMDMCGKRIGAPEGFTEAFSQLLESLSTG